MRRSDDDWVGRCGRDQALTLLCEEARTGPGQVGIRSGSMEMSGWRWLSNPTNWLSCVSLALDPIGTWWLRRGVDEERLTCDERHTSL